MCNVGLAEEPLEGSRATDAHLVSIPLVGVLSRGCWRAGLLLHHCCLPMEDLEEGKSADDNDKTLRQQRASEVRDQRVQPTGFVQKEARLIQLSKKR